MFYDELCTCSILSFLEYSKTYLSFFERKLRLFLSFWVLKKRIWVFLKANYGFFEFWGKFHSHFWVKCDTVEIVSLIFFRYLQDKCYTKKIFSKMQRKTIKSSNYNSTQEGIEQLLTHLQVKLGLCIRKFRKFRKKIYLRGEFAKILKSVCPDNFLFLFFFYGTRTKGSNILFENFTWNLRIPITLGKFASFM